MHAALTRPDLPYLFMEESSTIRILVVRVATDPPCSSSRAVSGAGEMERAWSAGAGAGAGPERGGAVAGAGAGAGHSSCCSLKDGAARAAPLTAAGSLAEKTGRSTKKVLPRPTPSEWNPCRTYEVRAGRRPDNAMQCNAMHPAAHHSSAVEAGQALADPQPQPRAAAALQSVAVELHELAEQSGLVLRRYACSSSQREHIQTVTATAIPALRCAALTYP